VRAALADGSPDRLTVSLYRSSTGVLISLVAVPGDFARAAMGLFSKRTGPVDIGHSPHDLDAMLSIVYTGVRDQLTSPTPEVSAPSPAGSIYLSRYGRDGLTGTAGNTIQTSTQYRPRAGCCRRKVLRRRSR
jgi:hypothetical protein